MGLLYKSRFSVQSKDGIVESCNFMNLVNTRVGLEERLATPPWLLERGANICILLRCRNDRSGIRVVFSVVHDMFHFDVRIVCLLITFSHSQVNICWCPSLLPQNFTLSPPGRRFPTRGSAPGLALSFDKGRETRALLGKPPKQQRVGAAKPHVCSL